MRLPTGSRVGLAMQCVGSCVLPTVETSSDLAEMGTAKHLVAEMTLGGSTPEDIRAALEKLGLDSERVDDAMSMDLEWLEEFSRFATEVTLVYNSATGACSELGQGLGRDYSAASTHEIVATADYIDVIEDDLGDPAVYVADLKTGQKDPGRPEENWQLKTLALMASRVHKASSADVALVWAPAGRKPQIRRATLSESDLGRIEVELKELAHKATDASTDLREFGIVPHLKTGSHCAYCPARLSCPAQVGIIRSAVASGSATLTDVASSVHLMTSDELTAAWQKAKPLMDAAAALKAAFAEAAKAQPFYIGDGKMYGLKHSTRTELDGVSVFRMLREKYGAEIAEVAVSFDASQASLERSLKAAKNKGLTACPIAQEKREAMKALEDAGAVRKVESSRLGEFDANDA